MTRTSPADHAARNSSAAAAAGGRGSRGSLAVQAAPETTTAASTEASRLFTVRILALRNAE